MLCIVSGPALQSTSLANIRERYVVRAVEKDAHLLTWSAHRLIANG